MPYKNNKRRRIYLWILGINVLLITMLSIWQQFPIAVETYYSRGFYPYFSYIPKILFGWVPFSVGDLFYAILLIFVLYLCIATVVNLCRKRYQNVLNKLLGLLCLLSGLYVYFYLSWGMNYYREPLQSQIGLAIPHDIQEETYLQIVDKYIRQANDLRAQLVVGDLHKPDAKRVLTDYMHSDTALHTILSKTSVGVGSPISSELVSHFTVAGYFNPFTHTVQVNEKLCMAAYPFTVVHELSHQMGIGFEDECNFIAFLKLKDHPNPWYAYSAAYETLKYLFRAPYFKDKAIQQAYYGRLSTLVKADYEAERQLWQSYAGWINTITNFFYSGYLKHNNQPEGFARYSMMSRLVVAWELQYGSFSDTDGQPTCSFAAAPL